MLRVEHLVEVQVVAVAHVAAEVELRRPRRRTIVSVLGSLHQVTAALLVELGALPLVGLRAPARSVLDRVPDVDEADVERREAEAQDVGIAVAARKSPITPRAISACTIGVGRRVVRAQADLAAAPAVSRGVTSVEAEAGAALPRPASMKQSVSASDLARSAAMPPCASAASTVSSAAFERGQRQDRRRAAQVARDARRRPVVGVNSNGAAWPNQPDSGCAGTRPRRAAGATQTKAGAPGPPLRYL